MKRVGFRIAGFGSAALLVVGCRQIVGYDYNEPFGTGEPQSVPTAMGSRAETIGDANASPSSDAASGEVPLTDSASASLVPPDAAEPDAARHSP